MQLEVIASSVEDAITAERGGATRIELCVALDQDGLTPPLPLMEAIVSAVRIPVRVMLRRRNDFAIQGESDLQALCDTATAIQHAGAAGLVLGFLEEQGVNDIALSRILAAAPRMKTTFHRAFDALADEAQQDATIAALKRFPQVDCILTAGGAGNWRQRAERLTQLQQAAAPEMEILIGFGVNAEAIAWLCQHTPLRAFHAGRAAREGSAVNGRVLEAKVRALRDAMQPHL